MPFDIDRLRHVVALDFTYESTYDATRTPSELLQFDEVDAVDTTDIATIRLKQRLQTKRPSATPDAPKRTVDLATLETEADFFPDPRSDNAGDPWSDVRFYARGNVTDDLAVLGDADYDPSDGKVDTAGIWVRVDHSPRTTWSVGSRYQRAISDTTLVAELSHEISDRWAILFLGQFDLDEKQVLDETFVLRRNLHRFTLEFAVDYDRGRDDTSVAVKIYPTGMPGRREYY